MNIHIINKALLNGNVTRAIICSSNETCLADKIIRHHKSRVANLVKEYWQAETEWEAKMNKELLFSERLQVTYGYVQLAIEELERK